jgi:hypothetical protein
MRESDAFGINTIYMKMAKVPTFQYGNANGDSQKG